jgi:flagellar assembly protein FliH
MKHSPKAPAKLGIEPESAVTWPLPEFESDAPVDDGRTNAFDKKPNWFEAEADLEEDEEEAIEPLTMEDIENLRQAAYEEGVVEGRQDGFAQGLDEGRLKGLEEGHQEGLRQGLEQGLAQGEQQIETLSGHWRGLIDQLAEPVRQIDAQVQQQVVELAMAMAAEIVRCELTTNPAVIAQTVKEAVAALPIANQSIGISLHPDDMLVIQGMFPPDTLSKKNWQLLADGSLTRGDCLIETELSSVTVSMKLVIEQSLKRFLRDNVSVKPAQEAPPEPFTPLPSTDVSSQQETPENSAELSHSEGAGESQNGEVDQRTESVDDEPTPADVITTDAASDGTKRSADEPE